MQDTKLLVSIVTYNSKDMFKVLENLKTHFADATGIRFAIFDNHSEEEYQAKLAQYADFADIHYHPSNEGFGFGHNYNLLQATEPYFLVLNPDVILTKDALASLLTLIEQEQQAGLVVPKVLNRDGSPQYLIRNRLSVLDYALRFIPFKFVKRLFDKRLATYECRDLPDDRVSQVKIGSGCCMLFRGEAFKQLNGFDDRYFMYFEDYDICLELGKIKYQILYNPQAEIVHFYGKEAHKNFHLFRIFMTSMTKFFNKWGWKFI